ncbi:MAG: hypothetical protein WD266_10905 [Balneolales bacterium]
MMANDNDKDVAELIAQAENHFENQRNRQSLEAWLSVLELDSTHYRALHETSLLYNIMGYQFEDEETSMEYYNKALHHAEQALEHHPDHDESHYVYSIALGRLGDKSPPRTRVRYANLIKEHAEIALELNPEHAGAWHVLGVWHHNAANLNLAERTGVRMLGGLPPSSNEEAEEAFKRAIELDSQTIVFYHDFAKFYMDWGKKQKAKSILQQAVTMEPKIEGDEKFLDNSKNMLANL